MSLRISDMLARMKSIRIRVKYTRISSTALRLLVDYHALHRQLMRFVWLLPYFDCSPMSLRLSGVFDLEMMPAYAA